MKPLFIIIVGLISLIVFNKLKLLFSDALTIIGNITFSTLLFLPFLFNWQIDIFSYIFIWSLFVFYKICSCFIIFNDNFNLNHLIIRAYIVLISLEILLFLLSHKLVSLTFQPNNSILSILLAAQFIFIFPFLENTKPFKQHKIFLLYYIILCLCFLFYTKGRAGILGFTIALIILKHEYLKSKIGYLKIVIMGTCTLLALINFKYDSSSGRLLIYKVIATQLEPKELITGVGYGKFKIRYNQLQAEYFSGNAINGKEALLADDISYMYNDPLQLIIEIGLIGVIILFFFLIKLFFLFKRNYDLIETNPVLKGALLSIICVLVSSFFMYPFQITGVLVHLLFCTAIIIQAINKKEKQFSSSQKTHSIISKMTLVLTSGSLLFFGYQSLQFYLKSEKAAIYANKGFRKKSIKIYCELSNSCIKDGYVLYKYSNELIKVNKTDSALIILQKANNYVYDSKSAELMGDLLYDKNNFLEAEKYYKQSVYMNPKLFNNRFSLFKFYFETKQFEKAFFWGNSILEMPVKIPSEIINNIKTETQILLSDSNFKQKK